MATTHIVELKLPDATLGAHCNVNDDGSLDLYLVNRNDQQVGRAKHLPPATARKFLANLNRTRRPQSLIWATLGYVRNPDREAKPDPKGFYQPNGQTMRHARAKSYVATFSRG